MSVSVTKAGPYYSSGSISFSSLRSNFTEKPSGTIKASELRRNTNVFEKNPIVPDSTENVNISTDTNLKLSQFRNSIKRYFATQSGTDDNSANTGLPGFRMGRYGTPGPNDTSGIDWCGAGRNGPDGSGTNGNLTRNIQKTIYITGTCGSYSTSYSAAQLDPLVPVYNITIIVTGEILAAGGNGGISGYPDGAPGGAGLRFAGTANCKVIIQGNGKIYGGGGGGAKGKTGANGASGTCYTYSYATGGCGGGAGVIESYSYNYTVYTGQHCFWRFCCERQCNNNYATVNVYDCYSPFTAPGAPGGEGGNGGHGQGYLTSATQGFGGALGTPGGCPTYGYTGFTGETGGDGGGWGSVGGNTSLTNGGKAGPAIFGTNYTVEGANYLNTAGVVNAGDFTGQ